jgi:hypothetical protein
VAVIHPARPGPVTFMEVPVLVIDNTSVPSAPQSWPDWLRHIGSLIGQADPTDAKIQFVANLIQDAAHEAGLHAISDPLAHYRFRMECAHEVEPSPDNGPAAPIQPGVIAGHPARQLPADDGGDYPW